MNPGQPGGGYPPNPYGVSPPAGGYGAPPQQGYGQPQGYGGYAPAPGPFGAPPPPPMMPYGGYGGYGAPMMMANQKNPGLAVALELIGGTTFQTFGIGHIYAGNVGIGLAWMFGYWTVMAINFVLCMVFIGFITWPLCWIAAMIISSITASTAAKAFNERLARGMPG